MLRFLKTKTGRLLAVVAILVGLYAVAGFVIAPKLVRKALLQDIPKSLAVVPAVGEIHINPFLFQVTVDDFSLAGADGAKLLGFHRLFVDFDLSSIWHRAYTFGNIDIDVPVVSAAVARDGTLNLMQLKPKPDPQAPPPKSSDASLPALRIGSFKVSHGLVTYEDRSRPDVFAARLEPLDFELRDFSTGVQGGRFTFSAATKQGERFEWHGHVSVQPIESDGEFQVNGLLVHTLWSYLEDRLNFTVGSGSVDLAATYKFSAGNAPAPGAPPAADRPANLELNLSSVALTDLTLRAKGFDTDWIAVPSLKVTGTAVDLAKRQAHVDAIALGGLKIDAWREPDGSINLMRFAASPGPPAGAAAVSAQAVPSAPAAPAAAPWQYDVRQLELRDAELAVEDRSTHPSVKLLLAPFALTLTGISQDLAKPIGVSLDTRLNEKGSVALKGEVTPQPAAADVDLTVAGLDLAMLQPYVEQRSAMTLESGALGAEAKIHYGARDKLPALQFNGHVAIDRLKTVDNVLHADLIDWDRLDIEGLNFQQSPDRLDIARILVRKPYARVIIEADESINVKRILAAPGAPAAPPPPASNPAPRVAAAPRGAPRRRAVPVRGTSEPPPAAASSAMPMAIKTILIEGGRANFADLSVTPNFSTGIQSLAGSIVGLSSRPDSRAKIDLHGGIDAFTPVTIAGEFNVLGPKLYTDIGLSFRNISLPIFNPYSGKFAGYDIAKGKLSTELHYKVDGRKLDAQHHVVIEQLEFGDKTESKQAVSLPIKLAVSLLKDRNGVIDLQLPITGTLDDPQFRIGPIIWKVFVNILEKAVTAPFALLGSLFGGGPDLQFVDFQPGLSTLDQAGVDKVKTIAKALTERPQLKIDVPIAVVPELDGPALIAAQYDAQLSALQAATHAPRPYDQLDPKGQLELLTRLYTKDLGSEPKYPEAVTAIKTKPELMAAKLDFLAKAIRGSLTAGDAQLTALGQARALALQRTLLADFPDAAERVFLVANDKATPKDGVVRLEMTLE